jgi:DNA mismatch repair ATPase MutL
LYGNIEDEEEDSDESSGDDNTTSGEGEGVVNSEGKAGDRANSDLSDGDEGNGDSDNEGEEQGDEEEEEEEEDESFIEIDTEEVFEHIAKGKSYATFEGTYALFNHRTTWYFLLVCTVHIVCCNILYCTWCTVLPGRAWRRVTPYLQSYLCSTLQSTSCPF